MNKKYYIAVDAGGTKTLAYLVDNEFNIIKKALTKSGNPGLNKKEAFDNIFKAIESVYSKEYKIECIALGISGLGTVDNKEEYQSHLENLYHTKIIMNNDGVIALYSVLKNNKNAIMVLAGTGSVVLATDSVNQYQIGGFGHLLIEKGSAYTCVIELLRKIINEYDNNDYLSVFSKEILKLFSLKDIEDIKKLVYNHSKDEIASLSQKVSDFSLKNGQAREYLENLGKDLALDVIKAYKKIQKKEFVLGFRGSFINKCNYVKDALIAELKEKKIAFILEEKEEEPILGAIYLAMKG